MPLGAQAANTVLSRIAGTQPAAINQAFTGQCISLGRSGATIQLARTDDTAADRSTSAAGSPRRSRKRSARARSAVLRREARKPGSYFWLKGGKRAEQQLAAAGGHGLVTTVRRARRAVHPSAAAAVHHRLRDPRLGNGIRRRAAGQLPAVGARWTWRRYATPRPTSRSSSPGRRSTRCARGAPRARSTSGRGCPSRCCSTSSDASADVVLAESVSMAMLVVLETLSPDERAVFVLREVFGFELRRDRLGGRQIVRRGAPDRAPRPRARAGPAQAVRAGRPADRRRSHRRSSSRPRPPATWTR